MCFIIIRQFTKYWSIEGNIVVAPIRWGHILEWIKVISHGIYCKSRNATLAHSHGFTQWTPLSMGIP